MTNDPAAPGAVFAGAQRAAGYVESLEDTTDIATVRAIRATLQEDLDDLETQAPATIATAPAGAVAPVRTKTTKKKAVAADVDEPVAAAPVVEPVPVVEPAPVDEPVAATPIEEPADVAEIPADVPPLDLLDVDLHELATVEPTTTVAREGFRGLLAVLGIKLAPSPAEQARLDAAASLTKCEDTIRQATYTRAVGILVANRKGGVGKTPLALLLGGTLAAVRGGSVAIVEVSDDPGALGFRAEGRPTLGLGDLVRDHASVTTAGQLAGYTAPQTSFASVIATTGPRDRLTGADVANVAKVVDEFYAMRVMDSGNQPTSSAFEGALEGADVLVVPTLNAGDAVLDALSLIEDLRTQGGRRKALADNAIIVRITDGRPEHPQVVGRLDALIKRANVQEVFTLPYDAHIAERGQITLSKLSPATYAATAAIAAGVIRALGNLPR